MTPTTESTVSSTAPTPASGRLRIALTLGDPRGIGPEVVARAVEATCRERSDLEVLLVGPAGLDPHVGPYHDVGPWDGTESGAGTVSARAIVTAVELALAGDVDALVTGPIHKPALQAAGYDVPGHTELLQDLSGARRVGMLMAAETTASGAPLRVLLATTHVPLREVPGRITQELLLDQTRLLHEALRVGWDLPEPRIGLCALNPHASDRGLFGDEEARVLEPAVESLRREGLDVTGPIPADTVFTRALRGEFDAVVAPYHDVGMAAFKTVAFGTGVNVTLGLPFVRTSPDHGTAFDLAGTGTADPTSTREALSLAARLSTRLARDRHGV